MAAAGGGMGTSGVALGVVMGSFHLTCWCLQLRKAAFGRVIRAAVRTH
jgi:hypothetical protein